MNIEAHKLTGSGVVYLHCMKNREVLPEVDTIVLHSTDGSNAMSSAHYLASWDRNVSAHLVIGRDGRIIQIVPFNLIAWHAGKSQFGERTEVNRFSIGIELDNAGQLHRRGDKFFSWFNREVMPSDVHTEYKDRRLSFWHNYPEKQIDKLEEVCRLLQETYPGIRHLVRHSDITKRKIDPGPAFPFEEFKKRMTF